MTATKITKLLEMGLVQPEPFDQKVAMRDYNENRLAYWQRYRKKLLAEQRRSRSTYPRPLSDKMFDRSMKHAESMIAAHVAKLLTE